MKMQTKEILIWLRSALFVSGLLALSYAGLAIMHTRKYQLDQNALLLEDLRDSAASLDKMQHTVKKIASPTTSDVIPKRKNVLNATAPGVSSLARLDISSIGLTAMIMEGVDDLTLRHAIGHLPGTALPGQNGNVVIAGHRDTFFRELRHIHTGDRITLTSLKGIYDYRVDSMVIVSPEDTEVLSESDDAELTLITCFPFYYVGSAPQRFIVRAHRMDG